MEKLKIATQVSQSFRNAMLHVRYRWRGMVITFYADITGRQCRRTCKVNSIYRHDLKQQESHDTEITI